MTTPTPDEHAAELLDFEEKSADRVATPLREQLAKVGQFFLRFQGRTAGRPVTAAELEELRTEVGAMLAKLHPERGAVRNLRRVVSEALSLGIAHAFREVGRSGVHPEAIPDVATLRMLRDIGGILKEHVAAGRTLVRGARNPGEVLEGIARTGQAVTSLERAARWGANRAAATGAVAVCVELGAEKLWIAERDACLHCLAYAGELAPADEDFAAGLTFADHPLSDQPVPSPPLHPNCRCRITPWLGSRPGSGTDVDLPAALKREARRSVVLGTALPGESEPARLRAADRLLKAGSGLPKSVEARGRRSVKRGGFR